MFVVWGIQVYAALDSLFEGVYLLSVPFSELPLILETDGSDDGWGAVLYQKIDGESHVIKMWSNQ